MLLHVINTNRTKKNTHSIVLQVTLVMEYLLSFNFIAKH